MHHDQHHGVLYRSLSSSTASQALLEQADVLARATSKQAVHAWLVEKSTEHTRALLLLFHLSHAVLVMSDDMRGINASNTVHVFVGRGWSRRGSHFCVGASARACTLVIWFRFRSQRARARVVAPTF